MSITWEPYGGGYIITDSVGGRHIASLTEATLVAEVEELRRQRGHAPTMRVEWDRLARERDEARADAERLLGALTCETCGGEGYRGYPDQQEPCPGCIAVLRELPGGRWFGVTP